MPVLQDFDRTDYYVSCVFECMCACMIVFLFYGLGWRTRRIAGMDLKNLIDSLT